MNTEEIDIRELERLVSNENMQRYVGGQIEVRDTSGEKYVYRSEIKRMEVSEERIDLELAWSAKGIGYPIPSRWVKDDTKEHCISFENYEIIDMGEDVLCFSSPVPIIRQKTTFFLPGKNMVDPSTIECLVLNP